MEEIFKELEQQLKSFVQKFREELQGIRSGRPTTQLLENIQVEYAGATLPVKQLGSLGVKPPREIDITVWDQAAVASVQKAIEAAKIGLSVSHEGNVIRAFLPPLTEERRAEFKKLVGKMAEEVRIKMRTHRDEANKKVKAAEAAKTLNEDQVFKGKEKIQKAVDEANKQIEGLVENKLKELQE